LFFQADYDEIKLQKISYGVILVTSWPLCHQKSSTKKTSQIFSILPPPPLIKTSGYASDCPNDPSAWLTHPEPKMYAT